eukprot:CAMPEP_0113598338 /NCGR_PEP_ID=MMETSP0015_2-20120614/41524_1 /TAXON_ID=2838 /ORGANISM="Odontella" /LENGTH=63 /DNA_ID=CAMNT_0000506329 /DNA_START=398 /DNA_END=586 /DNA_ORIENTATION=+ /assembly_acc=CAM_ASM_000160
MDLFQLFADETKQLSDEHPLVGGEVHLSMNLMSEGGGGGDVVSAFVLTKSSYHRSTTSASRHR